MNAQDYAILHNLDYVVFSKVMQYVSDNIDISREKKVELLKSLVEDQQEGLAPKVKSFLTEITQSDLFEKYYSNWGKYRRAATKEIHINNTFESISYFNKLILDLEKLAAVRDLKEILKNDIIRLQDLIRKTTQVLVQDDAIISTEEFDTFFGILYGIYEGIESAIGKIALANVSEEFLLMFRDKTKDKAFRKTILESTDQLEILKGLFSLGTHLVITAQNEPTYKEDCLKYARRLMLQIAEYQKSGDQRILEQVIF